MNAKSVRPCNVCYRRFTTVSGLYKHERNVHKISQQRSGGIDCPLCQLTVYRQKELLAHLKIIHNWETEKEELQFKTLEEFNKWKTEVEIETKSSYVKNFGAYQCRGDKSKSFFKSLFRCHRQGTYVDKVGEQRKHKFKSQGSNKIGSGCSSFIEMIHDGQNINVTYYKTHCGHSATLERVMLTKEDRIRIAGLIESGITLQHILDKICVSATEENFQRIHMITKKDLENICREFSLHTEKQNAGDATNVDVWVDGMNSLSKEENPVVFYKARGTCDMNNILSVDDFCLVIMTSFQKNMLEKFGNHKICVDCTQPTNAYDFTLTTIMTVDEFGSGFPTAFCVSNRKDSLMWTIFFELLKDKLQMQIKAEIFMSDDNEALYDAWDNVMGSAKQVLLSTWHVDKYWQINVKSKVPNKEKKILVCQMLRSILQEPSKEMFEKLMKIVLRELEEDSDTREFFWWFRENYANRPQVWAQCYREGVDINTNIYLESLHKIIKCITLEGQRNKRLDKCISILMKLTRDKIFERLIKLERNVTNDTIKAIDSADCKGMTDGTDIITTTEEGSSWKVQSLSESCTQYIVSKRNTICDGSCKLRCSHCKVCIHMYNCTCIDNIIKMNLCKHIHACMQYLSDTSTNVTIIELNPELRSQKTDVCTNISTNLRDIFDRIKQKTELFAGHLETCKLQENDARSIEQGLDGLLYLIQNAGLSQEITLQPKELSNKRKQEQETLHTTKCIRSNTDQRIPKPNVPMLDGLTIELVDHETMFIHSGFDHSYI